MGTNGETRPSRGLASCELFCDSDIVHHRQYALVTVG